MLGKLRSLLSRKEESRLVADREVVKIFRKRYAQFRRLLDANAALADLMADMDAKLSGNALFGTVYIRNVADRASTLVRKMAVSLQAMAPRRHRGLLTAIEGIEKDVADIIGEQGGIGYCLPHLTTALTELDHSLVDCVGGKSANLGEMLNVAQVPVPRGFAVTTTAYYAFMAHNGLQDAVMEKYATLDPADREGMNLILEEVRALIRNAELPPELIRSFEQQWDAVFGQEKLTVAVRSSAQAEDGDKSFAGQFLSELHVGRADLPQSYKRVVASLFSPSATLYRLMQGIPLSDTSMAVLCLEMVRSEASGIAYSHDPVDLLNETVVINGVWGLGKYAVDGIVPPDMWIFTRTDPPSLVRRRVGNKPRMLTTDASGALVDREVPEEKQRQFCLTDEEALALATDVLLLERHYGSFQDVEWAKDPDGRLIFLQSRPLDTRGGVSNAPKPPRLEQYPLLLTGEDRAFQGIGSGPVVKPVTAEELALVPEGAVLVGVHSKAEYAQVMDRVQAIITENGGLTGHMAILCREFRVPCLLNVPRALEVLKEGMMVTVDSFNGYVYEGIAEELLPLRLQLDGVRLHDTPVHVLLRRVAEHILPLNLTDPNDAGFTPAGCRTFHDVMRYVHELSYHEMFSISDSAVDAGGVALKLNAPLPIDLHIIDLDKGANVAPGARSVKAEEIVCVPLRALLEGMLRPDTMFRKPRPINMGGFLSVMGQQIATPQGAERFGDKSYAIISDRYMNFSSRVGYHYSVIDAYCGATDSKNYISFSFQGGAAGEARRIRRCRAIALVLEALGFTVNQQGDMVKSRFQKYPKEIIADRMDQLGRLLQVTRQMDMLMVDDASIAQFKEDFLNGIYR